MNPDNWARLDMGTYLGLFHPDGESFVTFWDVDTIRVWDLESGSEIKDHILPLAPGYLLVAVDPQLETAIAFSREQQQAQVWSIPSNRLVAGFSTKLSPGIQPVRYTNDGTMVLVRTQKGQVDLYDISAIAGKDEEVIEPITSIVGLSTFVHFDPAAFACVVKTNSSFVGEI